MFFPLTPLQCLKESQAWEFNKWFWKQHALKLILCCMLSTTTVNIPSLNFICRGNALQHLLLMAAYRCEKRKLWCEKRKKKPQNLSYSGLKNPRCSPTSPFPEGIQHKVMWFLRIKWYYNKNIYNAYISNLKQNEQSHWS